MKHRKEIRAKGKPHSRTFPLPKAFLPLTASIQISPSSFPPNRKPHKALPLNRRPPQEEQGV